jgi:hypothetical protein
MLSGIVFGEVGAAGLVRELEQTITARVLRANRGGKPAAHRRVVAFKNDY